MTKTDRFFYIAGWVLFGSLLVLSVFSLLTKRELTDFPMPCSFRAITGYFCPGCGGTHAVCSLARGQFLLCLREHAFVAYTAAGFFLYVSWNTLALLSRQIFRRTLPFMHFYPWYAYLGIAIIFIQCIVKNLTLVL